MSPTALRIAILGAGKIGSTFAFQLARVGHHDVTVVARPGSVRLQQLNRDGGILNVKGERAEVRVTDVLDEQVPYDLVIVTLLAHQVDALIPALQLSAAKRIQFMVNNFNPERLRDSLGAQRCSFGMPFVQASTTEDGKLNAKIGAGGQKSKMDHQGSVDIFNAAGLPAVLEPKMLLWLRCHAPLCVAFESVSIAGMRRGGGASWGDSMIVAQGLKESFTLIRRLGYPLYPSGKARLDGSPVWVTAAMLWSVSRVGSFRDLLATGVGECLALVDNLTAATSLVQPPVSVSKILAMKPAEA